MNVESKENPDERRQRSRLHIPSRDARGGMSAARGDEGERSGKDPGEEHGHTICRAERETEKHIGRRSRIDAGECGGWCC